LQQAADTAKAALAAQNGDYKALFAAMMQQVKSGMDTMKIDTTAQFKAITDKRDELKIVLQARIASTNDKEKVFTDATAALRASDAACSTAKNAAVAATAALNAASATFDSRNPVIEKELSVIRQLIDKVGELKAINLQESSGQEVARGAVVTQTRDMILSLQTFSAEAGPLSELIDLAREHAEYTKPILDLLNQLIAKLLAERDTITKSVSSAKAVNAEAQTASTSNCERKEAKRIEQ
jgi:hypothetical protein